MGKAVTIMMIVAVKTFYKVITINIDVFESHIIDERHFASREEAEAYKESVESDNTAVIIVRM